DAPVHQEGADERAALQRFVHDEALLAQIAQPGIGVGPQGEHRFYEGVERIELRAPLGEGSHEGSLRVRSSDLVGIQSKQIATQIGDLVETEQPLDLAAKNFDVHAHSSENVGYTTRLATASIAQQCS